MKKAAVYIRVSTDDQTELSPDSQRKELQKYAADHQMEIQTDHIYMDEGISGRKTANRPAFQKMIAAAKKKEKPFDVILLWKFSRFARNREDAIVYKSMLRKELGIDVISISEPTGDQKMAVIFEAMIEAMDEYYSINLSEEVLRGMTEKAHRGGLQTSPPFGWDRTESGSFIINPSEAQWYQYAREACLHGDSLLSIARTLNEQGIRTKRGNPFDARGIEYILRNPMQIGYVRWTPYKAVSKRIFDSPDTITALSPQIPPLINESEFQAVQQELNRRKSRRKKYEKSSSVKKHWLSGLLQCSTCGGSLTFQQKNKGFQCHRYGKGLCPTSHYISSKKVEGAVIEAIREIQVPLKFIKKPSPSLPVSYRDSQEALNKLLKSEERAKQAFLLGVDTLEEYAETKKRISIQKKQLELDLQRQQYHEITPISNEWPLLSQFLESIDVDLFDKYLVLHAITKSIIYHRSNETLQIFFETDNDT